MDGSADNWIDRWKNGYNFFLSVTRQQTACKQGSCSLQFMHALSRASFFHFLYKPYPLLGAYGCVIILGNPWIHVS